MPSAFGRQVVDHQQQTAWQTRTLGKKPLSLAGLTLILILGLCSSSRTFAANNKTLSADNKMNVVVIMADDVGYECFGAYGSEQYKTPCIDKMAREGVRFAHCHSTPLCTPSRIKLMTGRSNVRNYYNFGAYPEGEVSFAHLFKKRGYRTCMVGKWQLDVSSPSITPGDLGFDESCLKHLNGPRYWSSGVLVNGKKIKLTPDDYRPKVYADYAVNFIRGNKDRPFFLYFPMVLPHDPFMPTADSEDRQSKDRQKNFEDMVAYLDKSVGRVLDAITETGLKDNTLVLFTSDNGTHFRIHSKLGDKTITGGKGKPHDYGTHVPLVAWGNAVAKGQVCEDLIDFSDIFATITDATATPVADDVVRDGQSFWPQCQGKTGNPRRWLYNYYFPRPVTDGLNDRFRHYETRWARTKQYKLFGDGRFFDVYADPLEETPIEELADDDPRTAIRKELQDVLNSMPQKSAVKNRDQTAESR